MRFAKKSLGQNFLIDKNITNKIINLTKIRERNIIEIGPGHGSLTSEILKRKPKSLVIIEKDLELSKKLKLKYNDNKKIKVINDDVLKIDLEKLVVDNTSVIGNLPYNVSSQILVKFLKFKKWPPKYNEIIFMFQKELGNKIIGKFSTSGYGRLSILSNFRLKIVNKFIVSPNCFNPKPKVTSMVIHFIPVNNKEFKINKIDNLEKITNILFSNKRKMINKNIKKILNKDQIRYLSDLNLKHRPANLKPELYYKITELFERR